MSLCSLKLSMWNRVFIHHLATDSPNIYIYIYIERERERKRPIRKKETTKKTKLVTEQSNT